MSIRGTERVLIVDDVETIRELIGEVLTCLGYSVESCEDGESALVRLKSGGIDLILVDLIMPGRGGAWLVETMRDEGIIIPVIIMSGYPESICEVPCDGFLEKPYSFKQMGRIIRDVLDGRETK